MMILRDSFDYYLCDDNNLIYLDITYSKRECNKKWIWEDDYIILTNYYNSLLGYELGTSEYLFDEVKYFEYKVIFKKIKVLPTYELIVDFKAFIRDIKINNILYG